MPNLSTNAIRHFEGKVRALGNHTTQIILTPQEAKNLNHEITQILAYLVELQSQGNDSTIEVQVAGTKF